MQGGPIINAVLAFAIAVAMTGAGPGGRALHRLLSGRLWALLSELSYSAYLYHEQVRNFVIPAAVMLLPAVFHAGSPISGIACIRGRPAVERCAHSHLMLSLPIMQPLRVCLLRAFV